MMMKRTGNELSSSYLKKIMYNFSGETESKFVASKVR